MYVPPLSVRWCCRHRVIVPSTASHPLRIVSSIFSRRSLVRLRLLPGTGVWGVGQVEGLTVAGCEGLQELMPGTGGVPGFSECCFTPSVVWEGVISPCWQEGSESY